MTVAGSLATVCPRENRKSKQITPLIWPQAGQLIEHVNAQRFIALIAIDMGVVTALVWRTIIVRFLNVVYPSHIMVVSYDNFTHYKQSSVLNKPLFDQAIFSVK